MVWAVTRRKLLGLIAGCATLFGTPAGKASSSNLSDDISAAAAWIASALTSSGYKADFTPLSIGEIERFFDEQTFSGGAVAGGLLSEDLGSRLFALGSYCGEVLRREIGGEWLVDDADPQGELNASLKLANGVTCWPIQRVMKRFQSPENNLAHWALGLREG